MELNVVYVILKPLESYENCPEDMQKLEICAIYTGNSARDMALAAYESNRFNGWRLERYLTEIKGNVTLYKYLGSE